MARSPADDCSAPGTWFQVPNYALPALASLAKKCSAVPVVYLWLRRRRFQDTGEATFSHQEICGELMIDKSAVSRAVTLLEGQLIEFTHRGGVNFGKHRVRFRDPQGLFSPMQPDPKQVAPMQPAFSPEQPYSHPCNSLRRKTISKTKDKTTSSSLPPHRGSGKHRTKEEEEFLGELKARGIQDVSAEQLVRGGLARADAGRIWDAVCNERGVRSRKGVYFKRLTEWLSEVRQHGRPTVAAEAVGEPRNAFASIVRDPAATTSELLSPRDASRAAKTLIDARAAASTGADIVATAPPAAAAASAGTASISPVDGGAWPDWRSQLAAGRDTAAAAAAARRAERRAARGTAL